MGYHFTKTLTVPFDAAVTQVTEALKAKGFGILTTIDVSATLKNKLDVNFRPYIILGACNPSYAYRALTAEDKIGTMLPCNVVLQATADGKVEVSAIDPVVSTQAINNPALTVILTEVRSLLKQVIETM